MDTRIKFQKGKQRELLLMAKQNLKISQKELSRLLKISRRTLRNWLNERNLLPLYAYKILKEKLPHLDVYEKFIIEKLEKNWGSVKGGKNAYLKLVKKYGKDKVHIIMEKVRSKKKVNRKINVNFPVSNYTTYILKRKITPLPLLATLLMTDGNVHKNQITYGTIDLALRNIFIDLCKLNKVKNISEYKNDRFMRLYCRDDNLLKKLSRLSPSYKKSPNKSQNKKEYFKETQPSIKFLFNLKKDVIIECIRLAMSSDGSISIRIKKQNNKIKLKPQLALNSAHPKLCKEWLQIFNKFGMKMNFHKGKNVWSGIRGISTSSLKNMKKFQLLGGFIEGVKISKKSKRLSGVEKNKALKFILSKREIKSEREMLYDLKKLGP